MTSPNKSKTQLKTGIIGSLVAAACCFTPLLAGLFAAIGLAGLIGGIDYVVFPVLFASLGLIAHALYLRSGNTGPSPKLAIIILVIAFSATLIWLKFHFAIRIVVLAIILVAIYWFYLRSRSSDSSSSSIGA